MDQHRRDGNAVRSYIPNDPSMASQGTKWEVRDAHHPYQRNKRMHKIVPGWLSEDHQRHIEGAAQQMQQQ